MVIYNPKDWFKLIFRLHKSDTFRILLPNMTWIGIITWIICYVEKQYLTVQVPSLTIFHQISGFIISMVLVFRINSAYDRWWEGRKLWGMLINHSRNLSLKLSAIIPENDLQTRKELQRLISNYPYALKAHLRHNKELKNLEFVDENEKQKFLQATHKPNFVAKQLVIFVTQLCKKHETEFPSYLRVVQDNVNQMTDICGACERIKLTPIPYTFSLFIKKIIFLYIITMPFTFGLTIGYWSIPIVMIMFYAFASLELISEEIEDPFGTDANDLPIDEISAKIKDNVQEILLPQYGT